MLTSSDVEPHPKHRTCDTFSYLWSLINAQHELCGDQIAVAAQMAQGRFT